MSAPHSRRLTGSEVRARLQVLERRLEQRPLYAGEEAELFALLNGTGRKPVNVPPPRRVAPFRRRQRA
jgi:hypothetical protein